MKKLLLLFSLTFLFTVVTFADVRLPDDLRPSPTPTAKSKSDKKSVQMPLAIRVNPNFSEPTLIIPRSRINDLRAQLDEIDGGESNYAGGFDISRTQTLMSGLFLSAAFIFGGVWMFRGKSLGKNQKIVSGLLIFALLGASAYAVFANVAPPAYKGINSSLFVDKMKNSWRGAVGTVKIEVRNDDNYSGSGLELIIPPEGADVTNRNGGE